MTKEKYREIIIRETDDTDDIYKADIILSKANTEVEIENILEIKNKNIFNNLMPNIRDFSAVSGKWSGYHIDKYDKEYL